MNTVTSGVPLWVLRFLATNSFNKRAVLMGTGLLFVVVGFLAKEVWAELVGLLVMTPALLWTWKTRELESAFDRRVYQKSKNHTLGV